MTKPVPTRPKIGEPFNPYKRFNNVLIPEAMARSRELVPGAKMVYGRLRRYAGEDGSCYPAVPTLANEVALGERQVQKHLSSLERQGFLRRASRFSRDGGQDSNFYVFLWHRVFDEWENEQISRKGMNSSSPPPVHRNSPRPVSRSSPKEGQYKEGHIEEGNAVEGELDPAHSGSPKEGQGDPVDFGCLDFYSPSPTKSQPTAEVWKKRLKAARDAAK